MTRVMDHAGFSYLISVTASAAGRNAYFVAVAWLMMKHTESPSAVAALLAAGSCAEFLTSNLGGFIVDRFHRVATARVCDLLRIAIMAATAAGVFAGHSVASLVISWITYSVLDRTYLTIMQTMIPAIVRSERLLSFNSISYTWMQIGNLLAAFVAGLALASFSDGFCLLALMLCFLVSLSAMFAPCWRQERFRGGTEISSIDVREMIPGMPPRPLRLSAFVYGLIYAAGMMVNVLGSALVMGEIGGTALEFGYVEAGWAAGSVMGCLFLLVRAFHSNALIGLLVAAGLALTLFLIVQTLVVTLAQMIVLGVIYNIARVLLDVHVQQAVPLSKLGRVRSQVHTLCMAIGLLVYGAVAAVGTTLAPSTVFGLFGVVTLGAASAVLILFGTRPIIDGSGATET